MAEERLQKFLSSAGIASRRKCEDMITGGRVKVNGKLVTELGSKVRPGVDHVMVDGMSVSHDPRSVYLLLYKPTRVISAVSDPEGREVVNDLIPATYGRVYPVGRLDWDSEGAILMTNDGRLTDLLTHPKYEVTKVYMVKVDGIVREDDRRIDQLREGVRLDDGYVTQPADVSRDADTGKHTWFVVGIREGRNRQVRRMFEAIGLDVRKLKRISYGPVNLADMLPGDFRRLNEEEVDELYEAAGEERDLLETSRGRLHVARRARAQRDIKENTRAAPAPTRMRVAPEDLGIEGVFSKNERAVLQRQANEMLAGQQSYDGESLPRIDVDAPRRRPGEFRRGDSGAKPKAARRPAPAAAAAEPAAEAPKPARIRKTTGGRPLAGKGGKRFGASGSKPGGGAPSSGGFTGGSSGGFTGAPSSSERRPASGGPAPTGGERRPASGGQPPSSAERRPASGGQGASGGRSGQQGGRSGQQGGRSGQQGGRGGQGGTGRGGQGGGGRGGNR